MQTEALNCDWIYHLCFVLAGPTMKLKRPVVVNMYEETINEMYAVTAGK